MKSNETGFYTFDLPIPKPNKRGLKGNGGSYGLPPGIKNADKREMFVPDLGVMMVYDPYQNKPCKYAALCDNNCFLCKQPVEVCDREGGGKQL